MMRTWDIFDTLIARRCILPQRVFEIVEEKSGVKGFAQLRAKAGSSSLEATYKKLIGISEIDEATAERLKQMEIDEEIEQAIPIVENLRRVQSGDVLISDMYLPEEIIRRMLDKIGLLVPVEILITHGGKASGRIWKQLAAQNVYLCHTGDNQTADVKNPRVFGFDSVYTGISAPNEGEKAILEKDAAFGEYLRAIRLRNPFVEQIKRHYWTLATANIGVLLYFVKLLDALQKKYHFEYLGFCGRDTYYLHKLYMRLSDRSDVWTDYLYDSRRLLSESPDDIQKYFRYKIGDRKALLIDLLGTGMHINKIRAISGLKFSLMILNRLSFKTAASIYKSDEYIPKDWITLNDEYRDGDELNFHAPGCGITGQSTEVLNRATHNSPIKMKSLEIDGKIIPEIIFSGLDDTEETDVLYACLKQILRSDIQFPDVNWNDRTKALESFAPVREYFNNQKKKRILMRNQYLGSTTNAMNNQIA